MESQKEPQGGVLYVVATPLGNLADLSSRAAFILGAVDNLYAEDTRRARKLLAHLGLKRSLRSLHGHNEQQRFAPVLGQLAAGQSIALVSDAGTPLVSDPGARLVAAARAAGYRVSPIPGPSALTAALAAAGFGSASTDVLFLGFLPRRGKERRTALQRIAEQRGLVVFFEAPGRLTKTLNDLATQDGQRTVCVCRELTKLHEEIKVGPVMELADWAAGGVKGEITIVVGPTEIGDETPGNAEIDVALARCLAVGLSARDAATAVAAILGQSRRWVYARCQVLNERG